MIHFTSVRLVACAVFALCARVCSAQVGWEPLELAIMPMGAQPQHLFARHTATANDREAMGLVGPVRSFELRFERESETTPGEIRKQPGSLKFEFDEGGCLVSMSRKSEDPDDAAMTLAWDVERKEIGGVQRVTARIIKPGSAESAGSSSVFEYDDAGALVKITTRVSDRFVTTCNIVRVKPGGAVSAIEEVTGNQRQRRDYDENGRLVLVSMGPAEGEPKTIITVTWADGGRVRSEFVGGPTILEGTIDERGALTSYTMNYGNRDMKCERKAERDPRGNCTTLTTIVKTEAQEGRPARDWIMARWIRVIEYGDAEPPKPGPDGAAEHGGR